MEKINEVGRDRFIMGKTIKINYDIYNSKALSFTFGHLKTNDFTLIEKDLDIKTKKVKNFKDYQKLLSSNRIILNQSERK